MTEKRQAEISVADFVRDCVDTEKFSAYCRACRGYGKTWSCPPFDFKPQEIWQSYDTLLLQSRKIEVPEKMRETLFSPEELDRASHELLREEKRIMLAELLESEKSFPNSMVLSAGSCDVCPALTCTRLIGKPCRNPGSMRHSIESLGGDVGQALKTYFDLQILWGKNGRMPEYYILLGGLLKKAGKLA